MPKQTGLGRGLSSLIPQKISTDVLPKQSQVVSQDAVLQVPVQSVKPNPQQPRTHFDQEGIDELVSSIKEHGIIQPLIVTKTDSGYQVIAGERRLRAATLAGLKTLPVIVRQVAEQQKLEFALIENIQRRDLNALEEAVAYQRLIDEFNLTQEEVAHRLGKSRPTVTNTLRLLTLPTEIQKALVSGKITFSTARIIAGLPVEQRLAFFQKVLKQDLTVRAAEGAARKVSVRRHTRTVAADPAVRGMEEELQAALDTKVRIKKSRGAGEVVIEFYSEEELGELVRKIKG